MRELTTKEKGNITELKCATAFIALGYKISIPYGEDCPYDFIADLNGKLIRIQCKTSHKLKNGEGFEFKCYSVIVTAKGIKTTGYAKNAFDFFATIDNDTCYLVPLEECGKAKILRYCYPKNGQKKKISLATDFTLDNMIQKIMAA